MPVVMHEPDVETAPWNTQKDHDDPLYRKQLDYLFARSAFYRDKLKKAGFDNAQAAGGLADIARLPFTEKDELRKSRTPGNAIGAHLACDPDKIARIFSTSGTTGTPSYIPLTKDDLSRWQAHGPSQLRGLRPWARAEADHRL